MQAIDDLKNMLKDKVIEGVEPSSVANLINEIEKEIQRNKFKIKRLQEDKEITVNFLNKTVLIQEKTNQKLKDSNKQLSNFVQIASHDLKSPLRSISSFSGLLKKFLNGRLSEKEFSYLNIIESSSKSMSSLIDDLLNFAKINAEALTLKEVNVKNLVEDVIKFLDFEIKNSNAKIECSIDNFILNCDPIKLKQLFQNLISNAIKFSTSSTDRPIIKLDYQDQDDFITFSVQDNGIGVSEKYQHHIFQEFKKLNGDDFEGTGMGLSICKKIAEKHKGKIRLVSGIETGAKFEFTISKNLVQE